jgi:hypothetical protein
VGARAKRTHYTRAALRLLGERFAEALIRLDANGENEEDEE